MNHEPSLYHAQKKKKNQSRSTVDLNVKGKKALFTKGKADILHYIKIRNFCLSKDTIKRVKSEGTECEKIQYIKPTKNSYPKYIKTSD